MSLRSKLVLVLAGVIALYGVMHFVVQRTIVFPSFAELEQREALDDLHRVLEGVRNETKHLDTTCHDWAAWDDTYEFVETKSAKYAEANLQNSSLESARVDMMYFVRRDGVVARRVLRERPDGSPLPDLPEFPEGRARPDDPFRCVDEIDASVSGIRNTSAGPMILCSRPIVTSSREGPIRGYAVFGRLLDGASVQNLVAQTNVRFRLHSLENPDALPSDVRAGFEQVRKNHGEAILPGTQRLLPVFAWLRDMHGDPVVLVQADIARDLMNEGRRAIGFAMWSAVGAGILILCVLALLLQRVVVDPLAGLTAHTVEIGRRGDLDKPLALDRADEIGVLSREIDAMCSELARSRDRLLDSAHRAGMSQVAADVLHNVGNVLNSVHVSAREIDAMLERMEIDDLLRAAELLRKEPKKGEGEASARSNEILAFLGVLAKRLEQERSGLLRESKDLGECIDHLHQIVRSQQDLAGREEPIEVQIASELETAIRISGVRDIPRMEVLRHIAVSHPVRLQKHRLLQVLVNLLKNARESIQMAKISHPCIELRAGTCEGGSRIRIEVADNGVGIEKNRISTLFTPGLTTKQGGHGLGLHGSANAAREMGGSLAVRSEGSGCGATFTLELPVEAGVSVG
jgi:two-component system, NtrC family, sensor kinase